MVKPFQEYRKAVGAFDRKEFSGVTRMWYAYRHGHVVYSGPSKQTARELSDLVDTAETLEYKMYCADTIRLEQAATKLWFTDLQADYADCPANVFNQCYSRAYDEAHSSGHDAVVDRLVSLIEFATSLQD